MFRTAGLRLAAMTPAGRLRLVLSRYLAGAVGPLYHVVAARAVARLHPSGTKPYFATEECHASLRLAVSALARDLAPPGQAITRLLAFATCPDAGGAGFDFPEVSPHFASERVFLQLLFIARFPAVTTFQLASSFGSFAHVAAADASVLDEGRAAWTGVPETLAATQGGNFVQMQRLTAADAHHESYCDRVFRRWLEVRPRVSRDIADTQTAVNETLLILRGLAAIHGAPEAFPKLHKDARSNALATVVILGTNAGPLFAPGRSLAYDRVLDVLRRPGNATRRPPGELMPDHVLVGLKHLNTLRPLDVALAALKAAETADAAGTALEMLRQAVDGYMAIGVAVETFVDTGTATYLVNELRDAMTAANADVQAAQKAAKDAAKLAPEETAKRELGRLRNAARTFAVSTDLLAETCPAPVQKEGAAEPASQALFPKRAGGRVKSRPVDGATLRTVLTELTDVARAAQSSTAEAAAASDPFADDDDVDVHAGDAVLEQLRPLLRGSLELTTPLPTAIVPECNAVLRRHVGVVAVGTVTDGYMWLRVLDTATAAADGVSSLSHDDLRNLALAAEAFIASECSVERRHGVNSIADRFSFASGMLEALSRLPPSAELAEIVRRCAVRLVVTTDALAANAFLVAPSPTAPSPPDAVPTLRSVAMDTTSRGASESQMRARTGQLRVVGFAATCIARSHSRAVPTPVNFLSRLPAPVVDHLISRAHAAIRVSGSFTPPLFGILLHGLARLGCTYADVKPVVEAALSNVRPPPPVDELGGVWRREPLASMEAGEAKPHSWVLPSQRERALVSDPGRQWLTVGELCGVVDALNRLGCDDAAVADRLASLYGHAPTDIANSVVAAADAFSALYADLDAWATRVGNAPPNTRADAQPMIDACAQHYGFMSERAPIGVIAPSAFRRLGRLLRRAHCGHATVASDVDQSRVRTARNRLRVVNGTEPARLLNGFGATIPRGTGDAAGRQAEVVDAEEEPVEEEPQEVPSAPAAPERHDAPSAPAAPAQPAPPAQRAAETHAPKASAPSEVHDEAAAAHRDSALARARSQRAAASTADREPRRQHQQQKQQQQQHRGWSQGGRHGAKDDGTRTRSRGDDRSQQQQQYHRGSGNRQHQEHHQHRQHRLHDRRERRPVEQDDRLPPLLKRQEYRPRQQPAGDGGTEGAAGAPQQQQQRSKREMRELHKKRREEHRQVMARFDSPRVPVVRPEDAALRRFEDLTGAPQAAQEPQDTRMVADAPSETTPPPQAAKVRIVARPRKSRGGDSGTG